MKGKHADYERFYIDEELYLLKYADGRVKVVLKEGTLEVTEVMTRNGASTPGSHVFMRTKRGTHPKPTTPQAVRNGFTGEEADNLTDREERLLERRQVGDMHEPPAYPESRLQFDEGVASYDKLP